MTKRKTETRERQIIRDLAERIEAQGRTRAKNNMVRLTARIMDIMRLEYPRTGDDKLRLIVRSMFAGRPGVCEEMIMAEIRQLNGEIVPSEKPIPDNPCRG